MRAAGRSLVSMDTKLEIVDFLQQYLSNKRCDDARELLYRRQQPVHIPVPRSVNPSDFGMILVAGGSGSYACRFDAISMARVSDA